MNTQNTHWLDQVRFDDKGLVPAIAQDYVTGKVLMFAWMNREALQLTAAKMQAVYFSRSRNKLWHKGEESGHTQIVKNIRIDCDGDVVLLAVEQLHGIACHTGREACFFYELDATSDTPHWAVVEPVIKNPEMIYTHSA
jgi:phosphoribosyl-AMP cyclohydrolase